jgi:hypothetical protein
MAVEHLVGEWHVGRAGIEYRGSDTRGRRNVGYRRIVDEPIRRMPARQRPVAAHVEHHAESSTGISIRRRRNERT